MYPSETGLRVDMEINIEGKKDHRRIDRHNRELHKLYKNSWCG